MIWNEKLSPENVWKFWWKYQIFSYLEAPLPEGAESLPHTHPSQITFNDSRPGTIFWTWKYFNDLEKLTQETGGVESLESYWRIRLRILLNFQFTGMLWSLFNKWPSSVRSSHSNRNYHFHFPNTPTPRLSLSPCWSTLSSPPVSLRSDQLWYLWHNSYYQHDSQQRGKHSRVTYYINLQISTFYP